MEDTELIIEAAPSDKINEADNIKEIKNGMKLHDFDDKEITTLMKLAVIVNHTDGVDELMPGDWDKASARTAVRKDFHNIKKIPAEFMKDCAPELSAWGTKLKTQMDIREYTAILNEFIDEDTKQRIVRDDQRSRRFFINGRAIQTAAKNNKNRSAKRPGIPDAPNSDATVDMSFIDTGATCIDPSMFLYAPLSSKSPEWLEALVNSDVIFPDNFMEILLVPNKNSKIYSDAGEQEQAKYWESQKIPYLNSELCLEIAKFHPEAAITAPVFLPDVSYIKHFWESRLALNDTKTTMTNYFLKFPEEKLFIDMVKDINLNLDVFNHAPKLLGGTEVAFKYFSRHPYQLFDAAEEYQLEGLLLSGSIVIDASNIEKIKNKDLRDKIRLALAL